MIIQRLLLVSGFLASLLRPSVSEGQVRLPSLFGDHMVLQAGIPIPVWGSADPGETVRVTFKNKTYTAVAGTDGRWSLRLGVCREGGPYVFSVDGVPAAGSAGTASAASPLVFHDVLVGDVWLASGQSNMEFGIQTDSRAAQTISQATDPLIHFFYVPMAKSLEPQTDIGHAVSDSDGRWVVCSPSLLAAKWAWHGFSAISYYFARQIRTVTKGPVGLIGSYKGGTPAQAWMSLDALEADTAFHKHVLARRKALGQVDSATAAGGRFDIGFGTPACLFDAMIAPLIPYGIKGVLWYQGESNGDRLPDALDYKKLFPALIRDWRIQWPEGDFPFLFVQLPNFRAPAKMPSEGNWPWVREAQSKALVLPHTGMAVTIDLGDPNNIHPTDKSDVGDRLALVARHVVYGENGVYTGPLYDHMSPESGGIRLFFTQTGGGLTTRDSAGAASGPARVAPDPKGFGISGPDGRFVWAKVVLDGNTILVSSDQVTNPVAVRYDWADNPNGNVYNKEGLPLAPFRTDK
jgi:sialate O-acetylesterase